MLYMQMLVFPMKMYPPFNSLPNLSTHPPLVSLLVLFQSILHSLLVSPPTPLYLLAYLPPCHPLMLLVTPLPIKGMRSEPTENPLPPSPVKETCRRRSMTLQTRSHFLMLVSQNSPTLTLLLLMLSPAAVIPPPFCVSIVNKVLINQPSVLSSRRILGLTWSPTRRELKMCSLMAHVSPMMLVALLEQW